MVVRIPDHHLNTGQVKVFYSDVSIIQMFIIPIPTVYYLPAPLKNQIKRAELTIYGRSTRKMQKIRNWKNEVLQLSSHQELGINSSMFRGTKVGQEGGHLVEGTSTHGLGVTRGRQVLTDSLL